jgi:hypothetical protein
MASPSRKEKEDLNISAQIQGAQAMVSIRVNIQQHVTKQASFSRSHNPDNCNNQAPAGPPAFDKEKLLAMQAQVLQGRMQSNTVSPHSMNLSNAEIPMGPVKRQVAEAWNRQRNKRSHETPELERERQYKDIKRLGVCRCCEHYGNLCLQEDSLMTAEAREHYYLDINKKFPMQDPNIEGNAQAEDSSQSINLEDWTITFKEY